MDWRLRHASVTVCVTMDDDLAHSGSGSQALVADCICSSQTAHRSSGYVTCAACSKPVFLACLLSQYTQTGATALRNSVEWLQAFLTCCNMTYTCQACQQMCKAGIPMSNSGQSAADSMHLTKRIDDLCNKICNLATKMEEIQSEFGSKLSFITSSTEDNEDVALLSNKASTSLEAKPDKAQSYAQVLSMNISKAVKSSVAESLKLQKQTDRDKASVVIYGVPENNDLEKVKGILQTIGYNGPIICVKRMGRPAADANRPKSKKTCRALKVELLSETDCNYVLSHARWLKDNPSTAHFYIRQLLSQDKIIHEKALRRRCEVLNNDAGLDKKGRKRFVVLSGHLMSRAEDGRLTDYQDASVSKAAETKRSKASDNSALQNSPSGLTKSMLNHLSSTTCGNEVNKNA